MSVFLYLLFILYWNILDLFIITAAGVFSIEEVWKAQTVLFSLNLDFKNSCRVDIMLWAFCDVDVTLLCCQQHRQQD